VPPGPRRRAAKRRDELAPVCLTGGHEINSPVMADYSMGRGELYRYPSRVAGGASETRGPGGLLTVGLFAIRRISSHTISGP